MKATKGRSFAMVSPFTSQALWVIPRALMNARRSVSVVMRIARAGPAFITGQ